MPTTPSRWETLNRINAFAGRPEQAWQELRSMRSGPPGAAANGDRRNVFCAALEQAEGLLAAAKAVSNAVRPLPLFYGLSQASRAVAASAVALDDREWRLTSHGLSAGQSVREEHVADVRLSPQTPNPKRGNPAPGFYMLQKALDSPHWTATTRLGAVWASTPDNLQPLPHSDRDVPALRLTMAEGQPSWDGRPQGIATHEIMLSVGPVPESLLPDGSEEAAVAAVLSEHFAPAWRRTTPVVPSRMGGSPPIRRLDDGNASLTRWLHWEEGEGWGTLAAALGIDLSLKQVIPVTGGATMPSHRFILWWALLFGLSMRARYEPEGWTRDLDVDHSVAAVPLEEALQAALLHVPALIVRAIDEASGKGT